VKAVILAVAPDESLRTALDDVLGRRYGVDFRVVCTGDAAEALDLLSRCTDEAVAVAIVMAPMRLGAADGIEFFDAASWPLDRAPAWLETCIPGVFAAGDIRHGSTKRVAAAVGEGSTAAMLAGSYLTG
jgi:alkyl hydroperoxide reductase subunit AhpF